MLIPSEFRYAKTPGRQDLADHLAECGLCIGFRCTRYRKIEASYRKIEASPTPSTETKKGETMLFKLRITLALALLILTARTHGDTLTLVLHANVARSIGADTNAPDNAIVTHQITKQEAEVIASTRDGRELLTATALALGGVPEQITTGRPASEPVMGTSADFNMKLREHRRREP